MLSRFFCDELTSYIAFYADKDRACFVTSTNSGQNFQKYEQPGRKKTKSGGKNTNRANKKRNTVFCSILIWLTGESCFHG